MKNSYPISAIWILSIFFLLGFPFELNAQVRLDSTYTYSILSPNDSIPIEKRVCSYSNYRGNAQCFNFGSCIDYSWNFSFNRWEPVRKEESRREDDKNTRASISYQWDAQKKTWIPSYKDVVFSPNNSYNSYRYAYDTEREEWVNVDYFINRYSDNESFFELKRTDLVERTSSGRRETGTNNNIGQRVENFGEIWDDTQKAWIKSFRTELTYHASGRTFTETTYYWRNDIMDWELETFTQNNYDAKGKRSSVVFQNFRDFVDQLTEYEYDSLGNLISAIISRRINTQTPLTFESKRDIIIDTTGRQIGEENFRWENEMWVLDAFSSIEINSFGQDSLFEAFQWIPDSNDFILSGREETAYDDQNRPNDRKILYFSTYDMRYYGFRYQTAFDSEGRSIRDVYSDYSIERQEYIPQNRYDRAFNLSGQRVLSANYIWKPDQNAWLGQRKNTYSYVASGNYKRIGSYSWDTNLNEFSPSESTIYQWGVCADDNLVEQDRGKFRVFPNPADSYLHILSDLRPYDYELYSMDGRKVLQGTSDNNLSQLEVSNLQNGAYIISFRFLSTEVQKKVIINHP